MKKSIMFRMSIFLVCLSCICSSVFSQPIVKQQVVSLTAGNLRVNQTVVLQTIIFNQHAAGTAVVRFDGTCFADSGDLIVIAASHVNDWLVNYGNEGIEVAGNGSNSRSFSHTQVYTVPAGTDTFYAVAQNYVNEGGSGIASIYGNLTVEFFPSNIADVVTSDIAWSGNLASGQVPFDSINLPSAPLGKVYVHMDGQLASDAGDRMMLSVNYMPEWTVDDGSVACMAANSSLRISPYVHSRVYDVVTNPNTYYAIGENVVDQGGSGVASLYGNLCAELFPSNGLATLDNKGIVVYAQNLISEPGPLDSISISPTHAGKVLVQFDGYCSSSYGDQIALGVSDTRDCGIQANSTTIAASSANNIFNVFSHSKLFSVNAGTYKFYCIAKTTGMPSGSGVADVLGNFTVKYYPDAPTSIPVVADLNSFQLYPNPAKNSVIIMCDNPTGLSQLIGVTDLSGRKLILENSSSEQIQLNISSLPAGFYLVNCGGEVKSMIIE